MQSERAFLPGEPSAAVSAPGGFVIGTGRCGSTYLSEVLRAHPQVLSLSEFFTSLGGPELLSRETLSGDELLRICSTPNREIEALRGRVEIPEILAPRASTNVAALLLVTLPHITPAPCGLLRDIRERFSGVATDSLRLQLTRLFEFTGERLRRPRWVERSGASIAYARAIIRTWPDSAYVFLVRDGVDTAISMARHPLFRIRVARSVHGEGLAPEQLLDAELRIEHFGFYWSALMAETWRCMASVPAERRLLVRYEDLITDPAPALAGIARLLRLETDVPEWSARARELMRGCSRTREAMLPADVRQLERACAPGYRYMAKMLAAASSVERTTDAKPGGERAA